MIEISIVWLVVSALGCLWLGGLLSMVVLVYLARWGDLDDIETVLMVVGFYWATGGQGYPKIANRILMNMAFIMAYPVVLTGALISAHKSNVKFKKEAQAQGNRW